MLVISHSYCVHFKDEVTNKLTAVCKGDVVVWVPFPLPNSDACAQGVTCPTTAKSQYTFTTVIPISKVYPSVSTILLKYYFRNCPKRGCTTSNHICSLTDVSHLFVNNTARLFGSTQWSNICSVFPTII